MMLHYGTTFQDALPAYSYIAKNHYHKILTGFRWQLKLYLGITPESGFIQVHCVSRPTYRKKKK